MRDLQSQLRAYAEHLDATAPALEELDLHRPAPAVRPAAAPSRRRLALVAAGAALVVAGAVGVASLVFRTDAAQVTDATEVTTTLADVVTVPSSLTIVGDGPVLAFEEDEGRDVFPFAGPGGVVRSDDVFHMFFNRYGEDGSQVGYATSQDLITWQREVDALLTAADVPDAAFGLQVRSAARLPGGEWALYFDYEMKGDGDPNPPRIGIATAASPTGPWSVTVASVIDGVTSWSEGGVKHPSVVVAEEGLVMYFVGVDATGDGRIGRATSADGLAWSVDPAPVLEPTREWERGSLTRPNVVFDGERWLMLYAGRTASGQGFVASSDGVQWQPAGDEATLTVSDVVRPQIRDTELVVAPDGSLSLLVENGGARTTSEVWLMVVEQ